VLAVAGPVEGNRSTLTNSGWVIDGPRLCETFGLTHVHLVNDFEAVAWSLMRLAPDDVVAIGGGAAVPGAPKAVLGPGTGLGLSCLVRGSNGPIILGTEGGHVTLPATCSRDEAVIAHLRTRFGHVSAERVLSGRGLVNVYQAIAAIDGVAVPARDASAITAAALDRTCAISAAALDFFCATLGTIAGNVALSFGARGGVYIAGGIVPRFADYLARSEFRTRFEAKGRMRPYLTAIPTYVIIHADPAFMGLETLAERVFASSST
jgi:glucokinase